MRPRTLVSASFVLCVLGPLGALIACSSSSTAPPPARPTIECATVGGRCDCEPLSSGSTTDPCSNDSVGSPSICCGDDPFLQTGSGLCSCGAFACTTIANDGGSDCVCGQADPKSAVAVPKCTAAGSDVCCLSPAGDRCVCNVTATQCQTSQGTVQDDCSTDRLVKTCDVFFSGQHNTFHDCRTGL